MAAAAMMDSVVVAAALRVAVVKKVAVAVARGAGEVPSESTAVRVSVAARGASDDAAIRNIATSTELIWACVATPASPTQQARSWAATS